MTKHNTPALRFAGFDGEWEQSRLSDHLMLSENTNANREFGREDVYAVSLEDGLVNQIKFHGRSFAGKNLDNYDVIHAGEIVYTKSPLKFTPYGIFKSHFGATGIVSPLYAVYQMKPRTDARFVQDYFALPERLNTYLSPLVNKGAKNTMNISDWNALGGAVTFPPSLEEQRAIGELFADLDALIEQHRAKHANLQQTKTALMQRMFPQDGADEPELRLGGFSGAWEVKVFGSVATRSSTASAEPGLPRLEYEDIVSGVGGLNKDLNRKESLKAGLLFGPGDVLYGKLRPYLKNWLLPNFHGIAVGDFWVLQSSTADPKFVYQLIQTPMYDAVANISSGSKMPRADWKLVSQARIAFPPTLEEQRAIGELFADLDALIASEHRYITQLTQAKTALLQRMFV